jgi:hypothetical protein
MSLVNNLMAIAYFTTAFSFHAAAETVVVEAPGAKSFGYLRVNGQPSIDAQNKIEIVKGKKTVSSENIAGQGLSISVCHFDRNSSGTSKRGTLDNYCTSFGLNKSIKLVAGSYLLDYAGSRGIVEVTGGETKTINLSKIQVPRVPGKPHVYLYVDYKNEREQNKALFRERASMSQDTYTELQSEYWGRNFLKPYIDSGEYADVTSEVRQSYFSPEGELCEVNKKGKAYDCQMALVGKFSEEGERSVCRPTQSSGIPILGIYSNYDSNCKVTKVKWDQSRAYFLVLPGTYTLKWSNTNYYSESDEGDLVKSGITVN